MSKIGIEHLSIKARWLKRSIPAIIVLFAILAILVGNPVHYIVREFVYQQLSDRLVIECESEWEKVIAINSWLHVNEDQEVSWLGKEDYIGHVPLLDMVRGIGWCNQKAETLTVLLAQQEIKARVVNFPCHTIAEVIVDGRARLIDGSFNCEVVIQSGRYVRADGKEYAGDCVNGYTPRYGLYNNILQAHKLIPSDLAHLLIEHTNTVDIYRATALGGGGMPSYWKERYTNLAYCALHKARIYHLLGEYDKAKPIYKSLLSDEKYRDEASFFLVVLGTDIKDKELIDRYWQVAQTDLAIISADDRSYLWFIEPYIRRFTETYR